MSLSFGEKFGVVTVAHSEVNGDISLVEMRKYKMLLKVKQIYHNFSILVFSNYCSFRKLFFFCGGLCRSERRNLIALSTASFESYHGSSS